MIERYYWTEWHCPNCKTLLAASHVLSMGYRMHVNLTTECKNCRHPLRIDDNVIIHSWRLPVRSVIGLALLGALVIPAVVLGVLLRTDDTIPLIFCGIVFSFAFTLFFADWYILRRVLAPIKNGLPLGTIPSWLLHHFPQDFKAIVRTNPATKIKKLIKYSGISILAFGFLMLLVGQFLIRFERGIEDYAENIRAIGALILFAGIPVGGVIWFLIGKLFGDQS